MKLDDSSFFTQGSLRTQINNSFWLVYVCMYIYCGCLFIYGIYDDNSGEGEFKVIINR